MKKFIFIERTYKGKKGEPENRELHIYRLKNGNLNWILTHRYCTGSTQGATAEAFHALMDNGYIPKKYYSSSGNTGACGNGYFYGEVCKYYDIKEIY